MWTVIIVMYLLFGICTLVIVFDHPEAKERSRGILVRLIILCFLIWPIVYISAFIRIRKDPRFKHLRKK